MRVALIGKVHRLTERDHAPEEEKTARERDVQDMTGPASSQSGKAADGGGQRQDDDLVFAEGRVKPRLYANPAKDREQQRVDDAKAHHQGHDEQRAVGGEDRKLPPDATKERDRECPARMCQAACQSSTTRPEFPVIMTSKPFRKSR